MENKTPDKSKVHMCERVVSVNNRTDYCNLSAVLEVKQGNDIFIAIP
jgi:hypothetical protein